MRLKLICVVLVGLLVVAAGCGGKKKTTTTATTEAVTTSQSTTSATGGSNLTSEDCAKLAAASQTVGKAFGGTVPEGIDQDIARLQALAKVAPAEIRGDFEVLATAAGEVTKIGLKPGVAPTPQQLAQLGKLDLAKISQAATNIGKWAQTNCAPSK